MQFIWSRLWVANWRQKPEDARLQGTRFQPAASFLQDLVKEESYWWFANNWKWDITARKRYSSFRIVCTPAVILRIPACALLPPALQFKLPRVMAHNLSSQTTLQETMPSEIIMLEDCSCSAPANEQRCQIVLQTLVFRQKIWAVLSVFLNSLVKTRIRKTNVEVYRLVWEVKKIAFFQVYFAVSIPLRNWGFFHPEFFPP